jgi:hypothetical protein
MKRNLWLALAMTVLCGCIDVEDELTLNGDGSGSVRLAVKSGADMGDFSDRSSSGDADSAQYPPTSAKEAKLLFPAPGFEVKTDATTGDSGEQTLVIHATFKDANALLNSPYARSHALELKKEGNALVFRALSGMGGLAHFYEAAKTNREGAEFAEAMSENGAATPLKTRFKVNLPNTVTQGNGTSEGKSVTWLADGSQTTNPAAFLELVDRVLEARCAAGGVTFSPNGPTRPALVSFAGLQAGALTSAAAGPDAKQVEAAAKFVPCALQVQRAIDLSGKGYGGNNQARLVGFVVLPAALKPQRWGAPELEEALDAKGKSLKAPADEDGPHFPRPYSPDYRNRPDGDGDTEEDEDGTDKPAATEERQLVSFDFQAPDWNVKSIAKVKGSIALNYGGGLHLAKVTNAIPASWIPAAKEGGAPFDMDFSSSSDEGGRLLKNADLDRLGAKVTCSSVVRQMGGLMLQFQTESEACVIKDVQVYDADGKACPMLRGGPGMMGMDDNGSTQVYVGGEPKPPLSLALTVSGGGAKVKLPIQVENIPVRGR